MSILPWLVLVIGNGLVLRRQHAVARTFFHGKNSELCQRYRKGIEYQPGALGLIINAPELGVAVQTTAQCLRLLNGTFISYK